MAKTTKVTYARHGFAVALATATVGGFAYIGIDLGEEAVASLTAFTVLVLQGAALAVYAFAEKFLKRFTGEEDADAGG